ncbi:MAG TPA: hypothetical protein VG985_01675 [Xanthobacteraceae bacterium]|nr:hypothetical protein [Xanthobacteraceae bacterium]
MLTLAAGSALVGAVVGLRFQVFFFVLPVIAAALLIAAAGLAHGIGLGHALLAMGIATVAIQFGYVAGAAARFAIGLPGRNRNSPAHA